MRREVEYPFLGAFAVCGKQDASLSSERLVVLGELKRQYPNWKNGGSLSRQLKQTPPRFGHAILRSIAEAFQVTACALQAAQDKEIGNQKKFLGSLLDQGQEMLLRRQISGDSTLSRDLFSNSLRMAEHRELLSGSGDELASRRQAFARESEQLLSAINLLQSCYDQAWFDSGINSGD